MLLQCLCRHNLALSFAGLVKISLKCLRNTKTVRFSKESRYYKTYVGPFAIKNVTLSVMNPSLVKTPPLKVNTLLFREHTPFFTTHPHPLVPRFSSAFGCSNNFGQFLVLPAVVAIFILSCFGQMVCPVDLSILLQ